MAVPRVKVTESALNLLHDLCEEHGALLFHQSGGCCDGSVPMLLSKDEFLIDQNDVLLGYLLDVPFYMSKDQFEYWKHTQLMLDIAPGRGGSFSLESLSGFHFIIRSRLFSESELEELTKINTDI